MIALRFQILQKYQRFLLQILQLVDLPPLLLVIIIVIKPVIKQNLIPQTIIHQIKMIIKVMLMVRLVVLEHGWAKR